VTLAQAKPNAKWHSGSFKPIYLAAIQPYDPQPTNQPWSTIRINTGTIVPVLIWIVLTYYVLVVISITLAL